MKTFKLKFLNAIPFLMYFSLFTFLISCQEAKPDQDNEEARNEMLTHIVPLKDAVKLYHNYSDTRIALLKDSLKMRYGNNFNDTRTVWFDLETVKQYIAYVEKKSKENNIKPEGLQFYFSVYPNNDKLGKKKNHQTFFIAPTTKKDSKQSGYTLMKKGDKEKVVYLKDALNKNQTQQNSKVDKASFFSTVLQPEDGLLLNDGKPNPPGNNN